MDNGGINLKKAGIDLNKPVYTQMADRLAKEFGATPGRKRPRNPQEKAKLLEWQEKRSGKKIGEI